MTTMRLPTVPYKAVPVVPVEDLRQLLKACEGREFLQLRDTALIRLMLEPGGMRRAEVIGLTVGSIDLDSDVAVVVGKGRRPRDPLRPPNRAGVDPVPAGPAPLATVTDALWLGQKGALTDNGLRQMLERCSAQAGIPASTHTSCGTPARRQLQTRDYVNQ